MASYGDGQISLFPKRNWQGDLRCGLHPYDLPIGLSHLLLCFGDNASAVYRAMYVGLKKAGVGSDYKTYVFPDYVREIVRQRFATPGHYDDQYSGRGDVYNVTAEDLADCRWPSPPDDCKFCNISMPDTP